MEKTSLNNYVKRPETMDNYLSYNGLHFSKKMVDFAVGKMTKKDKTTGETKPIRPLTKQEVDDILKAYNIKLDHNELYDYVYVANMCIADLYGSSVPDEHHLAKYIKDVIDDDDAYDGIVFNRWFSDMCGKGVPIPWEEML